MKERTDRKIKIQPEYHLIVTEGTKTEPQYFAAIQNEINQKYHNKIQLDIFGEGQNTVSLFDRACARIKDSPNVYKHVWIVYDTDDFPSESINRTAELCTQSCTDETTFHPIWSNQCIELWFLLHFGFFHSDLHRSEYWPKLSENLSSIGAGNYTKNRDDIYSVLKPYMNNALANAKRLDQENIGRVPSAAAPGTKVYELIDKLKSYLLDT